MTSGRPSVGVAAGAGWCGVVVSAIAVRRDSCGISETCLSRGGIRQLPIFHALDCPRHDVICVRGGRYRIQLGPAGGASGICTGSGFPSLEPDVRGATFAFNARWSRPVYRTAMADRAGWARLPPQLQPAEWGRCSATSGPPKPADAHRLGPSTRLTGAPTGVSLYRTVPAPGLHLCRGRPMTWRTASGVSCR